MPQSEQQRIPIVDIRVYLAPVGAYTLLVLADADPLQRRCLALDCGPAATAGISDAQLPLVRAAHELASRIIPGWTDRPAGMQWAVREHRQTITPPAEPHGLPEEFTHTVTATAGGQTVQEFAVRIV